LVRLLLFRGPRNAIGQYEPLHLLERSVIKRFGRSGIFHIEVDDPSLRSPGVVEVVASNKGSDD